MPSTVEKSQKSAKRKTSPGVSSPSFWGQIFRDGRVCVYHVCKLVQQQLSLARYNDAIAHRRRRARRGLSVLSRPSFSLPMSQSRERTEGGHVELCLCSVTTGYAWSVRGATEHGNTILSPFGPQDRSPSAAGDCRVSYFSDRRLGRGLGLLMDDVFSVETSSSLVIGRSSSSAGSLISLYH